MAGGSIIHQLGVVVDDDRTSEEDVCSICLDAFDSRDNPPTVTTCKHEFHLQCILEWSQRSKECPICWQVILLKDSVSQELLSMVEEERCRRSLLKIRHVYEDPQDVEYADSDIEEPVIRSFEAATSSLRYERRNKQRFSGVGPSQIHPSVVGGDVPIGQQMYTSLEDFHHASSQDNLASSSSLSPLVHQTSPCEGSSISYVTSETPDSRDYITKSGVLDSHSTNGSPGRPIAADMHAFSESVKSKFSAASARYKESISKSTQGFKAKLLAENSPVKELSRGVQREMSAGIARIFERLDPTLKRDGDGINLNFFKGKRTQDNILIPPLHGNSVESPKDVSSNIGTMHL